MTTFAISKIIWNGMAAILMEAGGYHATVVPEYGANMVKLYNSSHGVDILHTPAEDEMELFMTRPQIFGLPLLFPPNRIADGKFTYGGRTYNFPITLPDENNHHHGTIRKMPFTVTKMEQGDDYVLLETTFVSDSANNAIFSYFPIPFECKMSFRLTWKGLEQTVTFTNLSDEPMPIGVGFHTAFNVPFIKGGNPIDYRVHMSVGERWELDKRTLPTGTLMPLTEDETKLRTSGLRPTGKPIEWALTNKSMKINLKEFNGAIISDIRSGVRVYYEVDKKMTQWLLWNNGGDKPYFCAEPQSWAINAPNLKLPKEVTGFNTIPPKGKWSSTSKIYIW